MKAKTSSPKTTRPEANEQREPEKAAPLKEHSKKFDAFPDKIDVRDWFYQPNLNALPDQVINCDEVPLILNQGTEGACTGFALAAVINYHLIKNGRCLPKGFEESCASPRMLYEMARRYDEWPGEDYEGSSARGTVKGWLAHGVVKRTLWKDDMQGPFHLNEKISKEAIKIPAGAYYRVMHKQIRDLHAALNESGALYATIMVHDGWFNPKGAAKTYTYEKGGKKKTITLPVIQRKGRATGGHAIALLGYTLDGFIVQNSWGPKWGAKGFAILPYEDWILHASDCWVVQLGVPIDVNIWENANADTDSGKQRAAQIIPLEAIRPYVINVGNNGFLSDSGIYWTTRQDITRMFEKIGSGADKWRKKRIMLYLHGGLNSEKEVAARIISFKQVFLDNEIYPVHIMWETDFWTSLKDNLLDIFTDQDEESILWLKKLREGTLEILDRTFELTSAKMGKMLWNEMKENARLASSPERAIDILAAEAKKAFEQSMGKTKKTDWELHIVAHSAGSIFTAYAIKQLLHIGVPIKSIQFMAPAISIALFKEKLLHAILQEQCPQPTIYALSDTGELDDNVGPYGKSLLYLISNAFENKRGTPLLGMERFINKEHAQNTGFKVDAEMGELYTQTINGWPSLVIAGKAPANEEEGPNISRANAHGGFDNDPFTMNSVLYRILGNAPLRKFTFRDLQY